jgi:type II secretory pathway pseudopilin PulG
MSCFLAFAASYPPVTHMHLFRDIVLPVLVLIIVIAIIAYLNCKKDSRFQKEINEKEQQLETKQLTIRTLRREQIHLQNQIMHLENWQHDAVKIYPDIQEQIDEMHAKAKAAAFDKNCNSAINRKASANSFHFLDSLMNAYNQMSDLEKSYVTTDISKIAEKWNKAAALYAGAEKHE